MSILTDYLNQKQTQTTERLIAARGWLVGERWWVGWRMEVWVHGHKGRKPESP